MSNLKEELMEILKQTQNVKRSIEQSLNTPNQKKRSEKMPTLGEICPKCNGKGYYFIDYNTVRECECGLWEQERQESKLRFATIPETYKNVRLADWKISNYNPEYKEKAKAIILSAKNYFDNLDEFEEQGKGFFFWSETKGSGKTMLTAAIANELVSKYRRFAKFATSLDILDEIRSTYNKDSEESESKLLNDLSRADFLIIDDFGTERVTDWVGEKFYQIINGRYINKKVTFYTSNHDLKTLKYDERILSRIRERSFLVHFPEQSIREIRAFKENRDLGVD